MKNNVLLDTNIVSAYLSNDPKIISHVKHYDHIILPSIVVGELYYGAYNSKRIADNIIALKGLVQATLILKCDKKTGDFYGRVRYELKKKGRMIPTNDIWIAALALQYKLPLVTRDKHFNNINDLEVLKW